MDLLDHPSSQFHIEFHLSVIFCPVFFLKAYLCHIEPFRKKSNTLWVSSLFLGNNRQHMPVCTKTISSWVRKVLCIAKAHMSPCAVSSAAASAALVVGVSLVSILQAEAWSRLSTPPGFPTVYCPGP